MTRSDYPRIHISSESFTKLQDARQKERKTYREWSKARQHLKDTIQEISKQENTYIQFDKIVWDTESENKDNG